jgi:hypothetical protein
MLQVRVLAVHERVSESVSGYWSHEDWQTTKWLEW